MITKESLIKATEDYDSFKFVDIGEYTIVGIATIDPDEIDEDCVIGTYDLNNSMIDFMGKGFSVDEYLFYCGGIDQYKLTNVNKSDNEDPSPLNILSEKQLADIILELLIGYIEEDLNFLNFISVELSDFRESLNTELKGLNQK